MFLGRLLIWPLIFQVLSHFPQSASPPCPSSNPPGCAKRSVGKKASDRAVEWLTAGFESAPCYLLTFGKLLTCSGIFRGPVYDLVFVVGGFLVDGLFPKVVREEIILNLKPPCPSLLGHSGLRCWGPAFWRQKRDIWASRLSCKCNGHLPRHWPC